MTQYVDSKGTVYQIELDACQFDMVRVNTGLDFCSMDASAYETIDTNEIELVKVLAWLCGVQFKEFARSCTGDALERGKGALLGAAADFFPPKKWSELQSTLTNRATTRGALTEFRTAMEVLPDGMKAGAEGALMDIIKSQMGDIDLAGSADTPSATGQDVTPSNSATDLPESAEQPPED